MFKISDWFSVLPNGFWYEIGKIGRIGKILAILAIAVPRIESIWYLAPQNRIFSQYVSISTDI